MKKNKLAARKRHALTSCLLLSGLLSGAAYGVETEVGLTAGASYTDNVFLDTSPNEFDDIVYQASPWLNIVHESPQLDANLNYRFNWYRYADLKRSSNFHTGVANATGKWWQDSLAVEIGANRSQVLSDPQGAVPPGQLQLAGSLIDRDEWYLYPRLNRQLGQAISLNAEYTYSESLFEDALVQEDMNHNASLDLQNYDAGQGLTWALRYDWRRTEYEISAPWEYQQATAELGYWVNTNTRIFGAGGKESDFTTPFDPALSDTFWEAGFAHKAGEKLAMEFAAGERTFGSSWRGNLDYTFRRGSTSISYIESPTTTGFNQGSGRRAVTDLGDITDFLNQPGSAERYVSKSLQWNLGLQFRRTAFGLSVFDEDRSNRTDAIGTALDDQSQTGAKVDFSWRAGVRTTFVVNGSIVDRETSAADKSTFIGAGLNIDYQLGNRTSLSLGYSYSEAEPLEAITNGRDYIVNVVSLLFTITK